jgi:hypothetical protein
MKFPWFILRGVIFIPITLPGWVILLAALAYAAYDFIRLNSYSHSFLDTLSNWVFNLFFVILAYYVIAWITSRAEKIDSKDVIQ